MSSQKKDLEIICNLQWKNRPHNGGERSNIIGVYDVPSTTLNWEIFKSYLLKNSGTPGDDVKVSYLATNDKEFPIQSQLEFQIALYAFRKKARNGEIINLKLDRISDQDKIFKKIPTSNDVQTQFDTIDRVGTSSSLSTVDSAPQWFTNHMSQFKKDIINEVSATVSGYLSTMKTHGMQSYHSRKSKNDSSKRARKHPLILCDVGNEKEFLKTIKLEKKVETKLEKLESKSKKLKEKKMSLLTKSSDSEAGQSSSKSNSDTLLGVDMNQMNAAPVRYQQSVIPHMIGGEVYLHTWEVINNGQLRWTSDTELHFTWGSASLEPVEKIVPCPPLKPGESGSINVLLNVPKICGQYESYWYFHHKGRKFGHWLGCQIIVDKINSAEPLAKSFLNSYEVLKSEYDPASSFPKTQTHQNIPRNDSVHNINVSSNMLMKMENQSRATADIEVKVNDLQIVEACSSSEKNQFQDENKISGADITLVNSAFCSSSTDFLVGEKVSSSQTEIEEVVLNASPSKIQIVEKCTSNMEPSKIITLEKTINDFKELNQYKQIDNSLESDDNNNNTEGALDSSSESISKIDEDTTSNSTLNDMVMINFPDEMEDHDTGYAYVLVDGTNIPIPKKYLRSDFLETAEDAPNPMTFVKTSIGSSVVTNSPKIIDKENIEEKCTLSKERDDTTPLIPTSSYLDQNTAQTSEVSYTFLSQDSQMVNDSVQNIPLVEMTNSTLKDLTDDGKSNPRMFVFPQNCPGYEVISSNPVLSEAIQICSDSVNPKPTTQYSFSNTGECNNQFMKCNIYQQDPPDTNLQYETLPYSTCHQSVFANVISQENTNNFDIFADSVTFPNQSQANNQEFKSTNSNEFTYVPNYQQTPPELRSPFRKERKESKPELKKPNTSTPSSYSFTCSSGNTYSGTNEEDSTSQANMHAPSAPAPMATVVSGAMTMASSALNTAKHVVNMIIPPRQENEPGVWVDGHWVVTNPNSPREANLQALAEMGFWDRDLNATLLARFNDDIAQVVAELIQ